MKTKSFLALCIIIMHISVTAQVKIGTNPTTINSASLLELEATNQGFVLPRVSINDVSTSLPLAAGLITGTVVYNTNSSTTGGSGAGIYLWNGSAWVALTTGSFSSSSWLLTGNSGLSSSTNFIGTTDAIDFVAKTANTERMRILGAASGSSKAGWIGMGITIPRSSLDVTGHYTNKNVLTIENSSTSGYSSVDMMDSAGNLKGTFGYANLGTGGIFAGKDYFNIYTNDFLFTTNLGNNDFYMKGSTGFIGLNTNAPSERLHVVGNFYLNGAFMPGGSAGTSGYVLTSSGAGISPVWSNPNSLSWLLTGNSGTSYATNFLGTADNVSMRFRTNNVQRIIIDSVGKVGIGLSNPSYVLSVLSATNPLYLSGVQATATFTADSLLTINGGVVKKAPYSSFNGAFWRVEGNSGTSYASNYLGTSDNVSMRFRTNNVQRMIIDSVGKVGIGLSNPAYALSVLSATNPLYLSGVQATATFTADSVLTINGGVVKKAPYSSLSNNFWSLTGNSGTNYATNFLGNTDNVSLRFRTNNTERMIVDSLGKVGIGLSNPAYALSVLSANNPLYLSGVQATVTFTADSVLTINGGVVKKAPYSSLSNNFWSLTGNSGTNYATNFLGNTDNVSLRFRTNNTERMIVDSLGKVGIGLSNPAYALSVLSANNPLYLSGVQATVTFTADSVLTINGGVVKKAPYSSLSNNFWSLTGNSGTNYATNFLGNTDNVSLRFRTNNTERMIVDSLGKVGIGLSNPAYALSVLSAGNPLYLSGVQATATFATDSVLTINGGVVKKAPYSSLSNNFWSLAGNSGTNYVTNFLGNTDNVSLRFRTNNTEQMIIDSLGHVGIGSSTFNALNPAKFLVDYGTTTSNTLANLKGSIDDYFQMNLQNKSSGASASSDYVATSDDGTDSTNYIDMGINSSTYAPGVENWGGPHDGYLYVYGRHLIMGTQGTNSDVIFLLGGGKIKTNAALRLNGADGNIIVGKGDGTTTPIGNVLRGPNAAGTNIAGGSLTLQGGSATGTAIGGALNISGGTSISGTGGSVIFNTSALERMRIDGTGNVGIGTTNPSNKLSVLSASNPLYLSGVQATATFTSDSILTINAGVVKKASYSSLSGAGNWSLTGNSGTTAGTNFIGTTDAIDFVTKTNGTERMRVTSAGLVGIGTNAPASDLTIYQSSGSGSSKGFTFTGNSIGGTNSGTGFLMSLGYNTTGNKQLWVGDADYAGNVSGSFARFVVTGASFPVLDAVSGDNAFRRYLALGVAGDANSGVIFGNDNTAVNPGSQVWDNGNMTIGSGYKSYVAPSNGLLVQGNVGIGTASPSSALSVLAASNPLYLSGVQATAAFTTDSILTIYNGVVKKAPSGATLSNFSATAPLTYNNTTGVFAINQSTTLANGYLSSTDWNTFNNKVGSITLNTPSAVFSNPINFVVSSGAATGTLSLNTQTANTVFAGPAAGAAATPTFRALVAADIPSLGGIYIQNQSVQQALSNFNISGNGTIGTNLTVTGKSILTGVTNTGNLTSSGGDVNINVNSNNTTSINSGTSTSNVVIGNSGNNILLPKFNIAGGMIYTTAATGQIAGTGSNMTWDNTNSRLGIGITSPSNKLSVLAASDPLYLSGVQATVAFTTDSVLTIFNGVVKKAPYSSLPVPANAWLLAGNSISAGNFLGTTNSLALVLKSNNTQMGYFDGNVSSIALGVGAINSSSDHNIAIGYNANTNNQYALALGYNATATGVRSVAIGNGASATTASGAESIAMGYNATSSNVQATAIGYQATASGSYGVALGYSAQATASQSTAIGYSSLASAQYTNAIGYQAQATGLQSTAIGYHAQTAQTNTILLGDVSTPNLYVGIGTATPSAKLEIIASAGNNPLEITGLPAGVVGTDNVLTINSSGVVGSVTPSAFSGNYWSLSGNTGTATSFLGTTNAQPLQFKYNSTLAGFVDANNTALGTSSVATSGTSNTAVGYSSTASNSATAIGANAAATQASNTAIGNSALANVTSQTTAIGASSQALFQYNTALGYNAQATISSQETVIGSSAQAQGQNNISIGYSAKANGSDKITVIGSSAQGSFQNNTVVGNNAQAIVNSQATAIGASSTAGAQNATALGYNASASGTNSVAIGASATTSQNNAIVLGTSTTNVGIGTSTPNAGTKLDVAGSFKLGTAGSILASVIKSSVTISPTVNLGTTTTYTATVTGAATGASVMVNPRAALANGVVIAYSYVSGANTITIAFTSGSTTGALGSLTFDVTVIQ